MSWWQETYLDLLILARMRLTLRNQLGVRQVDDFGEEDAERRKGAHSYLLISAEKVAWVALFVSRLVRKRGDGSQS